MQGATSSTLYRIELRSQQRSIQLVLRLLTNSEWLLEEPDLVRHEASNLVKVQPAGVPTPELVAIDADGVHCGVPAILMTSLPGRVDLLPENFAEWLLQQALGIISVHHLEIEDYPWHFAPYNDASRLKVPAWSKVPDAWARAIAIAGGSRPAVRMCFIHRDFHPTNVLWQGARLSGIVDWPNACLGPAAFDVAWNRLNLAGLFGVKAADQFLQAYQSQAAPAWHYDTYWDLLALVEILPGPPDVYPPWVEFGIHSLNNEVMLQRMDVYLTSLLSHYH